MKRLLGLETEYGIQVEGAGSADVVVESMELIRCCCPTPGSAPWWDYERETPRMDARGFEVERLRNDEDETIHLQRDRKRRIPLRELKSDLVLPNGARLYNDHTHPEYSTPECYSLFELVAADRAGERILLQCARRRSAARGGGSVRLYKNNTDFEGHSYGCHENFLIRRRIPFEKVIEGLVPFVVTRQIFAGAGKVGVEREWNGRTVKYQISQRADFFDAVAGIDTMHDRPLINTRDEPHADREKYRRLHLIAGDANLCEFATALKLGSTALVLDLMEAGRLPLFRLEDPVSAFKEISRDPSSRRWAVALKGGGWTTALEIQRALLEEAARFAAGRDPETDWVLREWEEALGALERDPGELIGRCDWATKKWLLDAFAEEEGLDWENPDHLGWLQSQDLEYHNVDPEEGLYLMLERTGRVARLTSEEEIVRALGEPPRGSRAYFRGKSLEKFGEAVRSLGWDRIEFAWDGRVEALDLGGCVEPETARRYNEILDSSCSVEELLSKLKPSGQEVHHER